MQGKDLAIRLQCWARYISFNMRCSVVTLNKVSVPFLYNSEELDPEGLCVFVPKLLELINKFLLYVLNGKKSIKRLFRRIAPLN